MAQVRMSQPFRAILLLVYTSFLFGINFHVFGRWIPLTNGDGLWFYAGFASLLLGNFLVTPYYTKPIDTLSYSVLSFIAIYSFNEFSTWEYFERAFYIIILTYNVLLIIMCFIQILTKDSISPSVLKLSNTVRTLVETSGTPNMVFGAIILFSLLVFHRESANEFEWISLAWILLVLVKPEHHLIVLFNKILAIWRVRIKKGIYGKLIGSQNPHILLVEPANPPIKLGNNLIERIPRGLPRGK